MGRNRTVVGLDVGTTKTCVVVGQEYRDTQLHVLGIGTAPSLGLKGGQVVDIVQTIKAIDDAVMRAEEASQTRVRDVVAGIAGGHLQSHSQHAELRLGADDPTVRPRHMNSIVRTAAGISLPAEREIAAVIPKTFSVDHLTDVLDPRGLTGRSLKVEAHVVTGATNAMTNLERCVTGAGCDIQERVLQPLASAASCLTEDQRREGAAVVDIGGGTTDVAIYVGDACWHIAVLPMGGALVTADIARGLRLPLRVAEALKIQHGRADPWVDADESAVEVPGFDYGAPVAVRRRDLAQVINARMEEIFTHVRDEIVRSGYYDVLPAGVVLTGGGSQISGLAAKASDILELPVVPGRPQALWGLDEAMRAPQFSTAIGLTIMGAAPRPDNGWLEQRPVRRSGGVLTGLGSWLRGWVSPASA